MTGHAVSRTLNRFIVGVLSLALISTGLGAGPAAGEPRPPRDWQPEVQEWKPLPAEEVPGSPDVRRVNPGRQNRHLQGTQEAANNGGGVMASVADAQDVLNAFHTGEAQVLGARQGKSLYLYVRVPRVTGYHNNANLNVEMQPTNVFMLKGTQAVSVVPVDPNWRP